MSVPNGFRSLIEHFYCLIIQANNGPSLLVWLRLLIMGNFRIIVAEVSYFPVETAGSIYFVWEILRIKKISVIFHMSVSNKVTEGQNPASRRVGDHVCIVGY